MGEILIHFGIGIAWTIGAFAIAYIAAIVAAFSDLSFGGIGRMLVVGVMVFVGLEIAGFAFMGIF